MTLLLRTRLSGKHIYDPNNIPSEDNKKKCQWCACVYFQLYKLTKPFDSPNYRQIDISIDYYNNLPLYTYTLLCSFIIIFSSHTWPPAAVFEF